MIDADGMDGMDGAARIAAERRRQVEHHGWSSDHDDEHENGDLAMAAACYAAPHRIYERAAFAGGESFSDPWPWDKQHDARPYDGNVVREDQTAGQRIRLLEKAGALIAAEIDRLLRASRRPLHGRKKFDSLWSSHGMPTAEAVSRALFYIFWEREKFGRFAHEQAKDERGEPLVPWWLVRGIVRYHAGVDVGPTASWPSQRTSDSFRELAAGSFRSSPALWPGGVRGRGVAGGRTPMVGDMPTREAVSQTLYSLLWRSEVFGRFVREVATDEGGDAVVPWWVIRGVVYYHVGVDVGATVIWPSEMGMRDPVPGLDEVELPWTGMGGVSSVGAGEGR